MKCKIAAKLTPELLEGSEASALKEHMQRCSDCRAEMAVWDTIYEGLSSLEQHDMPGGLHARILASAIPSQFDCDGAKSRFSALYENELTFAEAEGVRQHLASCNDCWQEYSFYAEVLPVMGEMEMQEPPARVAAAVRENVAAIGSRGVFGHIWPASRAWILSGAAAVVVFLGFFVTSGVRVTPSAPQQTASVVQNFAPPTVKQKIVADADVESIPAESVELPEPQISRATVKHFARVVPDKAVNEIKIQHKPQAIDTAKAVASVVKKNQRHEDVEYDHQSVQFIPKAEDVRYELAMSEPIKKQTEPEIVATAADISVYNHYDMDDSAHFEKIASIVQSKNTFEEDYDAKVRSAHPVVLPDKSGNIPIIGIRF